MCSHLQATIEKEEKIGLNNNTQLVSPRLEAEVRNAFPPGVSKSRHWEGPLKNCDEEDDDHQPLKWLGLVLAGGNKIPVSARYKDT